MVQPEHWLDAPRIPSERQEHAAKSEGRKNCLDLWRDRIDYSVNSSSCAFNHTVRNVPSSVHAILRHVSCRSHRFCLDSAHGNGERENYRKERFHSTK